MFKKIAPLALASLLLVAGPTGTAFADEQYGGSFDSGVSGSISGSDTNTNNNADTNTGKQDEPQYGGEAESDVNIDFGHRPVKPDPGPDTKPEVVIPDGNNGGSKEEPETQAPDVEQPEDNGQKDTATKDTKPAEKQADKATLPQTGEANSTNIALLGLTLIALGSGAFVFAKQGSRKNYEK